ncbi:hypothetical protein LCGC14_3021740, partial [marine sediment metagenome]
MSCKHKWIDGRLEIYRARRPTKEDTRRRRASGDAPMTTPKRFCYFIPTEALIPDHGYRVSIVFEDEPGHSPTGTWPYSG